MELKPGLKLGLFTELPSGRACCLKSKRLSEGGYRGNGIQRFPFPEILFLFLLLIN